MIIMFLKCAMRFSELADLKFNDIDFYNKEIILRKTKNGKDRIVFIDDELQRHLEKSPFV
jgi:integrase